MNANELALGMMVAAADGTLYKIVTLPKDHHKGSEFADGLRWYKTTKRFVADKPLNRSLLRVEWLKRVES